MGLTRFLGPILGYLRARRNPERVARGSPPATEFAARGGGPSPDSDFEESLKSLPEASTNAWSRYLAASLTGAA
jgi:hypothetical protein